MNGINVKNEKKYILGLDVSTSTVGICLFEDLNDRGELVELTHCSLKKPKADFSSEAILAVKAKEVCDFIFQKYENKNITEIYIEEPLQNSKQPNTAAMLNLFGGMVYAHLNNMFNIFPEYIHIDKARRYGLPELVGEKNTLWKPFPKEISGVKINNFRKLIILSLIAKRFKNVKWLLNNNFVIDKKNYDRADSIVVVLGAKALKKQWKNTPVEIFSTLDFIQKNINYETFIKEKITTNKTLLIEEKKQLKVDYLNDIFEINKFLNVKIPQL